MSTIQNLKNFIRHGKQARANAEPTTNVSNVHAQQQRHNNYAPPPNQHVGNSEPMLHAQHQMPAPAAPAGGYSTAAVNNQNAAARAADVTAKVQGDQQKLHQDPQDYDPSVVERIVAEERETQGKMPRYPGLERWRLVEKMGDGAFSNVYRARDTQGQYPEVAIKVVRKFEMNSNQVSKLSRIFYTHCNHLSHPTHTSLLWSPVMGATLKFTLQTLHPIPSVT